MKRTPFFQKLRDEVSYGSHNSLGWCQPEFISTRKTTKHHITQMRQHKFRRYAMQHPRNRVWLTTEIINLNVVKNWLYKHFDNLLFSLKSTVLSFDMVWDYSGGKRRGKRKYYSVKRQNCIFWVTPKFFCKGQVTYHVAENTVFF